MSTLNPDRRFCLPCSAPSPPLTNSRSCGSPHAIARTATAVMPAAATMIELDSMREPSAHDSLLPDSANTDATSNVQHEMANRRAFSRGFAARRRRTAIVSPCGAGLRDGHAMTYANAYRQSARRAGPPRSSVAERLVGATSHISVCDPRFRLECDLYGAFSTKSFAASHLPELFGGDCNPHHLDPGPHMPKQTTTSDLYL